MNRRIYTACAAAVRAEPILRAQIFVIEFPPWAYTASPPVVRMERYDCLQGTWRDAPAVPTSGYGFGFLSCGDHLYFIGGWIPPPVDNGEQNPAFRSCYRYDVRARQWSEIPPMRQGRCYFGAAFLQGRIYVLGGWVNADYDDGDKTNSVEAFDPGTDTWVECTPMGEPRADFDAVACQHRLLVFQDHMAEIYDPSIDAWASLAQPPLPGAVDWYRLDGAVLRFF